jgi:hypothetical protein
MGAMDLVDKTREYGHHRASILPNLEQMGVQEESLDSRQGDFLGHPMKCQVLTILSPKLFFGTCH